MGLFSKPDERVERERTLKVLSQARNKLREYYSNHLLKKNAHTEKKLKKKAIHSILELVESGVELYEDDACTIQTTKEHLEEKSLEELVNLFENIIIMIENEV